MLAICCVAVIFVIIIFVFMVYPFDITPHGTFSRYGGDCPSCLQGMTYQGGKPLKIASGMLDSQADLFFRTRYIANESIA